MLLLDREAMLDLSAADVRFLCDRHAGIGADGVLRAVLAKHIDGWTGDGSLWFMDYRNADGSIAEMCGNGVRVFVRFLTRRSRSPVGPVVPGRDPGRVCGGDRAPDGRIRVAMGPVSVGGAGDDGDDRRRRGVQRARRRRRQPACGQLRRRPDRTRALTCPRPGSPADDFPDGVNLEFVRVARASGTSPCGSTNAAWGRPESCGTGTVAAAAAARAHQGETPRCR